MRCKMSMVHEFELGMISMVDLKHKVRQKLVTRKSLKLSSLRRTPHCCTLDTATHNVFAGRAQTHKAPSLLAKGKYSSYA